MIFLFFGFKFAENILCSHRKLYTLIFCLQLNFIEIYITIKKGHDGRQINLIFT